jgi:CO/xanthine dehydrogenase Mo-binding subunit
MPAAPPAGGSELSRSALVKRGGALVVGLGFAGSAFARRAGAVASPFASAGPPDPTQAGSYLAVHADGTASVKTGRVELGQGSMTGLLLIAAEELDMSLEQLTFVRHDTNISPDTGGTFGSSSIAIAGAELRSACTAARGALLDLAAAKLGVPVGSLGVSGGVVTGGGSSVSYGELVGGRLLAATLPFPVLQPGQGASKPISQYGLVGISRVHRLDIPAKVAGTYVYVHGVRVPGMLHARLVRPLGQGAYGDGTLAGVLSVDERSISHLGDARVLRRGDLLAVVAAKEYDAIQAATTLRVVYRDPPEISGSGDLFGQMRALDTAGEAPARIQVLQGDVDSALGSAAHALSASYAYHFQGHMPIGPSCAVADVGATGALVLCNTQDAYTMRGKLAQILALPVDAVRVQYWEGASTFGNSPARYDAGEAAAVISQLAGSPVRLQFMRWDEQGWDNYGPALLTDMRGAVDDTGNLVALDDTAFGIPALSVATDVTMQNIGIAYATPGPGSGDAINSGSQYAVPNRRVTAKSLPIWNTFFKTSALRAPHCPQTCFASEQMVDELAHAAGIDPYEFRLQNIATDQVNDGFGQWRDVLEGVAELAGWKPRVAASRAQRGTVVRGRGIALGGFAASQAGVVAEIEVNRRTGKIAVTHLYGAQVAGFSVYLPGIENQMEGNLIMGTSRAIREEVPFNRARSLALDWVSYPILRFQDAPRVSMRIVQRKDLASTGSGEPPSVPVPAAIANAFFDATGVRIRMAPMTPGRVRAVLAAGKTD